MIPVENVNEVAQYLERLMLAESKEDKNPFLKEVNLTKPTDILVNCIRTIPKIGEKNARTLATIFQSE